MTREGTVKEISVLKHSERYALPHDCKVFSKVNYKKVTAICFQIGFINYLIVCNCTLIREHIFIVGNHNVIPLICKLNSSHQKCLDSNLSYWVIFVCRNSDGIDFLVFSGILFPT